MAALSVRGKTSLLAGPLGTLPTFGDAACAQDAVVPTISTIKLHSVLPKSRPLERRELSDRSCIAIGFSLVRTFNFVLCIIFLFSESQPSASAGVQSNPRIQVMLVQRPMGIGAFSVPSQSLTVCDGHYPAGLAQQQCSIGNRGVLHSSQHKCRTGQGVERSNDVLWIDLPKRRNLVVRKHGFVVGVFGG